MTKLSPRERSNFVWSHPVGFLAFGFGSGLIPVAPGTFGTLASLPLYLLIAHLPWMTYLVLCLIFFLIGIVICNKASQFLGVHDFSGIVWDEVVGYLLTMFLAPPGWIWMLVGFVLFRIFDVWKPQPIGWMDKRIHGGLGIMLDDVLAAMFAWIVMYALRECGL